MANIIVTTPKTESKNAALEAASCIAAGGGGYFRRVGFRAPKVKPGAKLFYVEHDWIRGYGIIKSIQPGPFTCSTTGRVFGDGWYVLIDATSWTWIVPIPQEGFRGWRYFRQHYEVVPCTNPAAHGADCTGWLDPKPKVLADVART